MRRSSGWMDAPDRGDLQTRPRSTGQPQSGSGVRQTGQVRKRYHFRPSDHGFEAWDVDRLIQLTAASPRPCSSRGARHHCRCPVAGTPGARLPRLSAQRLALRPMRPVDAGSPLGDALSAICGGGPPVRSPPPRQRRLGWLSLLDFWGPPGPRHRSGVKGSREAVP